MKPIHILLVEDNEGDILLTTEALSDGKLINKISVVKDGLAAINFLEKKGEFLDVEKPDLILLDVNLPKLNGQEVLKNIKQNEKLKHIPVIVLTTSSAEKDIFSSYQNHANCYITKPVNINNFFSVVTTIEDFWFNIVKLPQNL